MSEVLTHEEQLKKAQELIEANTRRLREAEELKLQSLKARAAQVAADKAREQAEIQAKHEAAAEAIRQRRAAEKAEADRQRAEEAARNAKIEADINRQEEVMREQNRKQAELDRLNAHAAQLARQAELEQIEAQRLLDLVEAGIATKAYSPSADPDEAHKAHPLGRFLQSSEPVVPQPVEGEISSEQLSLQQQRIDQLTNQAEYGNVPVYAQPPSQPEPVAPTPVSDAWRPVPRKQRFADSGASFQFETALRKGTGIQVNPQRADALTAVWEITDVLKATDIVIAEFKRTPFGCDAALYRIESILENPPQPEVEVVTPEDASFVAQVKKYSVQSEAAQIGASDVQAK